MSKRFLSNLNPERKLILFLCSTLLLVCFFGQQKGNAQEDSVPRWLLHTHDKTNFPLTGRHRTIPCKDCHRDNVFEGTPSACEVCHWNRRNDDRYQLRLGTHCGDCHTTFSWKNVPFDKWNHGVEANYPLRGVHRTLDCVQCHGEKGFVLGELDCLSCHGDEFESSRNPNHLAAGFSFQCWLCHVNEGSWQGVLFSHDLFPLKEKHRFLQCSECHTEDIYKGLESSCFSCHLQDYTNTTDPDHEQLGYPLECEVCHGLSAGSWENASFVHEQFVLRGKHRTARCLECHGTGIYEGLPTVCVYCHLDDWLYAENPNHKQFGFHTDCEVCHGYDATSWIKTSFNHNSSWPLQGIHVRLDCVQCHHKGRHAPHDCVSCHRENYDAASSPDHKRLGFSLDCQDCHLPSHQTWGQASFSHRFPIKSGRHAHLDCVDCHVTASFRDFSCLNCHDHEKSRMDRVHRDTAGYTYQSYACLACHFNGKR